MDGIKDARGVPDDVDLGAAPRLGPRIARVDEKQPQDLLAALIGRLIENFAAMHRQLGHRRGVRRRMVAVDAHVDFLDPDRLALHQVQLGIDDFVVAFDLGLQVVGEAEMVVAMRLVKNPQPLEVIGESARLKLRARFPWRSKMAAAWCASPSCKVAIGKDVIAFERNRADLPMLRRIEIVNRRARTMRTLA